MLGGRASIRAGPIVDVCTVCVCVPLALYDRRKPVVMVTPQRVMPYAVTLLAQCVVFWFCCLPAKLHRKVPSWIIRFVWTLDYFTWCQKRLTDTSLKMFNHLDSFAIDRRNEWGRLEAAFPTLSWRQY